VKTHPVQSQSKEFLVDSGLFLFEIFKTVAIVVVLAALIRYLLVQPFYVVGSSMKPTYHNGDYLLIDEISYRFESPQRGDVIVLKYPPDPSLNYIKRIVGLPGDRVVVKDGKVTIFNAKNPNGFTLTETYIASEHVATLGDVDDTLGKNEYFVLGDNRFPEASSDSRDWGNLPRKDIIGKVWLRAWPPSDFGLAPKAFYTIPK
jgi:signal peptidase I